MQIIRNLSRLIPVSASLFIALSSAAQSTAPANPANQIEQQITAYLAKLADLHCTETVVQQKLAQNGHVEATERASYDYLIMIDGNGDGLQLNESRIESASSRHRPLPMLVTNGFSTALLVFHPYYRDSFQLQVGPEENIDGRQAIPVHFSHIPGKRTPAALSLRGREYPLDLQGTAWVDKQTGSVLKVEENLLHDMSDVGLTSLAIQVAYKPADLGAAYAGMALPSLATVEVTTPRQHWKNSHLFESYKTFSTDAEQDPNVKLRASSGAVAGNDTAAVVTPDSKEKP